MEIWESFLLACYTNNVARAMKENQEVTAKTPGGVVLGFIQVSFLPEVSAV